MFELCSLERTGLQSRFVDKRLERRYERINASLEKRQSSILNQVSAQRSERKAGYDFFHNARVPEQTLRARIYERLMKGSAYYAGQHLLVLSDTTEYNYAFNKTRLRDISSFGTLTNEHGLGYFAHVSMVMNQADLSLIGLSDIQIWHREQGRPGAHTRKKRFFEDKESYKWYASLYNSHQRLQRAGSVTYVQDRDGDIYESICKVKDIQGADLVVRNCRDRKIELEDGTRLMLYGHLAAQCVDFTYELKIKADKRKNRTTRLAQLEVRSQRVKLVCPEQVKKYNPASSWVDVVWVREASHSVPAGESPIDWKLITTHQVAGHRTKAAQIIAWYESRWLLEEFFFITKTGAYDLEHALLESSDGLRKLGIMVMDNATKILQLRQARQGQTDLQADAVFDEKEQRYIEKILPSLEGKTEKLKNPYPVNSLARAAWVIARLGGWKGYATSRLPGMQTFKRGLDKFNTMVFAWEMDSS